MGALPASSGRGRNGTRSPAAARVSGRITRKPCALARPRSIAEPTCPTGVADRPSWSSAASARCVWLPRPGTGAVVRTSGSAAGGRPASPASSGCDQRDQGDHRRLRIAGQPGQEPGAGRPGRSAGPAASGSRDGRRPCSPRTRRRARPAPGAGGRPVRAWCRRWCRPGRRRPTPAGSPRCAPPGCPRTGPPPRPASMVAPQRRSQPGICGPSESRTRPSPGVPVVSSSSPNTRSAARGRAAAPSATRIRRSPPRRSRPGRPRCRPAAAPRPWSPPRPAAAIRASRRGVPLTSPAPSRVDSSTRIRASAPAGTIAPVAISTQVPSSVSGGAMPPASTRPTGRHGAGPRTAQPSMLEVGKAGRSVRASSGSARVRPSAASSGTISAGPAAAGRLARQPSGRRPSRSGCSSALTRTSRLSGRRRGSGRPCGAGSGRAPPGRPWRRRSSRAG